MESTFDGLKIGILELQGDFQEHTAMIKECGNARVIGVRQVEDLAEIDALVIPGGESTVMSKLLVDLGMTSRVKELAQSGLPMFGTCAGCILLAKSIRQRAEQPRIGAMDIEVDRNAYGSQIDSFEAYVKSKSGIFANGPPLRVVHIRAPAIVDYGPEVEPLATHNGRAILARQGSFLACTFHPELTRDSRVHTLFLNMVVEHKNSKLKSLLIATT